MNDFPPPSRSTPALDVRELRAALGSFITGVIVVTAAYESGEHGMTANSFTSVSLVPPLVLVCIDNNARMARVLERGMHFGLSILACGQERISRHFAGRAEAGLKVDFTWHEGVPLIAGAVSHFVCRVMDSHVAGDHTVQIAAVEHFARFARPPLLFYAGSYLHLPESDAGTDAARTPRQVQR